MKAMGAPTGDDEVYTDSAFFFDMPTGRHLLAFYTANKPLTCEVDAYGDFLQALGPLATAEYTGNADNVISESDALATTRLKLYEHLKGTQLNVVLCNWSKFYHIGTLSEYLHHYCSDAYFATELGCSNNTFSTGLVPNHDNTLIHSSVHPTTTLGSQTVVEYSVVKAGVQVGSKCLISSAVVPEGTTIPDQIFLHTTATTKGFVSIVFGTTEDLKKGASYAEAPAKLTYCNHPLGQVLERLGCPMDAVWPASTKKCTLWNAKIFAVQPTMAASCAFAAHVAAVAKGDVPYSGPGLASMQRFSMEDILQAKDLPAILAYRADLRNEIAAALGEAPATHANADQGALLLAFAAVAIPFAAVFLSQ